VFHPLHARYGFPTTPRTLNACCKRHLDEVVMRRNNMFGMNFT
jgi:hypothetical protein